MTKIKSELLERVATNVRVNREQRGLSREQLAASTDVDPQMIKRIESGRANPALVVLSRLAAAMTISLSLLAGGAAASTAEPFDSETVGETIVLLRKGKHLSQRSLAQLTGLRTATLRRYESGETDPRLEGAELIARALEMKPTELVQQIEQRQLHADPSMRTSMIITPGVEQRVIESGEHSELWEWRFAGRASAQTTTPAGIAEEIATAIRGDLVVTVDGVERMLRRGGSMTIATKQPWQIANNRTTTARLLRFQVRI